MWDNFKQSHTHIMRRLAKEEREMSTEKLFEKIMANFFSKFDKNSKHTDQRRPMKHKCKKT